MSDNMQDTVPQDDMLSDEQLDAVAGGVLVNDGGFDANTGVVAPTTTTTNAPVKTATPLVARSPSTTTGTTTYTSPQTTYVNATNTALSGLRSTGG